MLRFFAYGAVLSCMTTASAFAQQVPEMESHGAVLCSYTIVTTLSAYAETCARGQIGTRHEMVRLRHLHRDFIARNGPATQDELMKFEAQQTPESVVLCNNTGPEQMLSHLESDHIVLAKEIKESLGVDREPVWNPCL